MCSQAGMSCATTLSTAASMKAARLRVGVTTEIVTMRARRAAFETTVPAHSSRHWPIGTEIDVVIEFFDQMITQGVEIGRQTGDVAALDQHVAKPVSLVIDALQHLDLRSLNIERKKIDPRGSIGFLQDRFQGAGGRLEAEHRLLGPEELPAEFGVGQG